MPKKETTLSVLKEMRDILKRAYPEPLGQNLAAVYTPPKLIQPDNKFLYTLDFPSLTAQEILTACSNSVNGGKILYSDLTGWYEKESFFTTEKTREGKRTINLELLHKNKSWNECNGIAIKEGMEMLNFAEVIYLLKVSAEFRKMLTGYNWTWTSSRSSSGGLVNVGKFDSNGAGVFRDKPDYSDSDLGVCFSRSGVQES